MNSRLFICAFGPDLNSETIQSVVVAFLNESNTGQTLVLIFLVIESRNVSCDTIQDQGLPKFLQNACIPLMTNWTMIQVLLSQFYSEEAFVLLVLALWRNSSEEHHHDGDLKVLSIVILEDFELVLRSVVEDITHLGVRYCAPSLVKRDNIVKPSNFFAKFFVILILPLLHLLVRLVIVYLLPDGPFEILVEAQLTIRCKFSIVWRAKDFLNL